ncbi:hypothetical protein BCV69DRAFT_299901 [Microstroma glucosiphilum]|uniref:Uncharacterized protein n=1 Tax=Pseudomicrostroma glucosiphilum TaxID=1684307 RepID=A0A316U6V0_9BASI|nr:hypothetical protein BCV69DRAFT_299901 [Pseudomicrostroma glucosiphilum]PWN20161.1 hypothetical protein BCV69DRAFT_299901 [Pseudomicrostroma glucosiphilum]
MRYTYTLTVLATTLLCLSSANRASALHCAVKDINGEFVTCPAGCDVDTLLDPVCKDAAGGHVLGAKKTGCWVVFKNPAYSPLSCKSQCEANTPGARYNCV